MLQVFNFSEASLNTIKITDFHSKSESKLYKS